MATPDAQTTGDEHILLAVLNSSPVTDGRRDDLLVGDAGAQVARELGGIGSPAELAHLRSVRGGLQRVVRGDEPAETELSSFASGVALKPALTGNGIEWELAAPPEKRLAARVLLAWSNIQRERPGRLRACANVKCNLFLIDHSRPGTAKWCSMSVCGNRMKARAHAQRTRRPEPGQQ